MTEENQTPGTGGPDEGAAVRFRPAGHPAADVPQTRAPLSLTRVR